MTFEEVKELTQWLEKSDFTSYALSIDGVYISVSKQPGLPGHGATPPPEAGVPFAQTTGGLPITHHDPAPKVPPGGCPGGHIISSPIVGVYYESANAESAAFVQVGQQVKRGDTLCILEAMKVMNEITADADGVVADIFVQNGAMVEACMPLFRLIV